MNEKNIMSEEAFDELINGFEYVGNLTKYGKENIKYHVLQILTKEQFEEMSYKIKE